MKRLFIINRLIEAIILLIPILLISGPFLSDLSIIFCCILILLFLKKKLFKLFWENNLIRAFILFYLYIVFCSLIIPIADGYFVKVLFLLFFTLDF